jgi:DNA recombination protein RmuC
MNLVLIALGSIISFIISYLYFRARSVAKSDFDELNNKYQETLTKLKITEAQQVANEETISKMVQKIELKQDELMTLSHKTATLDSITKNQEQKIFELSSSVVELSAQNKSNQVEIIRLNHAIAEEMALTGSLTENIANLRENIKLQAEEMANLNNKKAKLMADNSTLAAYNASHTENLATQKSTILVQSEQLVKLTEKVNLLYNENSTLIADNRSYLEKLTSQKQEMIEIQRTAHLQFERIATQIVDEKANKIHETNRSNIEALLKPLGENIENFKKKVDDTYDKESKQRFSLEEKVRELVEQTNKVSTEANNLASALKGQIKKQGNWGEMILESILQKSGLVKDREYFVQPTIKGLEGNSLRPDVLVKLPDNRVIIIDSKVSLVSYDRFSSSETIEEQTIHLTKHLKSIYAHIDDLYSKKYDNLDSSLDFTMMFIPIEPAYLIAIQSDQELWSYAYSKRILLISPTNLIACLKLMADLWKRELQSKNAMEIVKRGELLYEKFVLFVNTLEEVGKQIGKTQQSYTMAMNQLNSGSGHLVGQALKLRNLGLKSSKDLPDSMLPMDYEPDVDELGNNEIV